MLTDIRYLYLLKNILKSNFSTSPNLYKLNLIVTYKCNFKCKTCFIWKKKDITQLATDEYEKIFSKINVNWIDISGGEIFLRNDIKDIISLIIKSQKRLALLHFATNGFLTDKIQDLVDYILTNSKVHLVVSVSLDGPEEIHNSIKGINSWRKSVDTYKNLRRIKDRRFKVFPGYTISSFNFDKINNTIEALKREIPDIDYSDIHINIEHGSEHYYGRTSSAYNKELFRNSIKSYMSKRKYKLYSPTDYLEYRYQVYIENYLKNNKTPLKCRALINSIFIDPQGNIFPCSIYNRNLGNLRDNGYNLYKVLKSEQAKVLRQEIKKHICPQCWTPCEAYQMILASFLK